LKFQTSRSRLSAAARVAKLPTPRRFPVLGFLVRVQTTFSRTELVDDASLSSDWKADRHFPSEAPLGNWLSGARNHRFDPRQWIKSTITLFGIAMKKTILITGAGTGIGRDAAFALAKRGHSVVATTIDNAQADALRTECRSRQQPMNVFKLDITSAVDRTQVASLAIDVLINNAAIGDSGSLAEVDVDRIRRTFEVNVFSTLELTQLVLKGMIERERGTVVFISSIAGRVPAPFLMPYAMTKFALSAAGAALRAEMDFLGKNINVTIIEPGAIRTGFNQVMIGRKYEWMKQASYFSSKIDSLKAKETRGLALVEARSTDSIVAKFVKAAEASRPKLRYGAPWIQSAFVRLARMFGV
jgi:short-subunit dehydrogenase